MRKITKLLANERIRSIDEKTRTAEYIISSDHKDRMGEVVDQSWDLENYKKNPIVLWGHDPSDKENVLGQAVEIKTEKEGDHTITTAKVKFAEEGTSAGVDTVWKLIKQGILRTVSVGFIPHTFKTLDGDPDTTVLADNELLEFSIVPIPANPNAVALAFEDGSLTEDDAKYLLKAYKSAGAFVEKSLYGIMASKKNGTDKEKSMSDEEIAKIAEAVGSAVSNAIGGKLDEILEKVSGDEGDEDKPENGDEGDGGNQLADDDKPEDDKPEDDKPADDGGDDDNEDEDDDDKDDKKSLAKSKQKDEGGADEDEIDEDAEIDENEELTPAQEKAVREVLGL